jgi:hypothetical protein
MTITEDIIKASDELGFAWGDKVNSFYQQVFYEHR